MRVLIVNRADAFSKLGGDTVQMKKTCQALEKLGFRTEICLTNELQAHRFNYDLIHLFNIQNIKETWNAFELIQKHKVPFVLSSIYWEPFTGWFSMAIQHNKKWKTTNRIFGNKISYKVFFLWQYIKYTRSIAWKQQQQILNTADAVLPNSKAEVVQLMKIFKLQEPFLSKVHVIHNGVDVELFNPRPKPSIVWKRKLGEDFILEVGRISPEKNSLGLIKALWNTPVNIVFIGSSSSAREYARECYEAAKERRNVKFIENIPHEELPGIYALAKAHVLPSFRETPGLATLEAAATGCKVVSTSVGCAHEYLGDEAIYCDPTSINSILEGIKTSMECRGPISLRERVIENYTWDIAAKETLKVYEMF